MTFRGTSSAMLVGALMLSTSLVAPAYAQSAPDKSKDYASSSSEIIVTARKRQESVQDVPISINVMTKDFVRESRIESIKEVLTRIPGVNFTQAFSGFTVIAMRGSSTQDDYPGSDPSVNVFIDEVYVGTTVSDFDLLDLERVEVLKGPQGTLFGRNTTGGLIHYVTRDPSEDFRATGFVSGGNHGLIEGGGTINGKIADDFSGSLAVKARKTSGYQRNIFTGRKRGQEGLVSARGKLRYSPSEDLNVVATLDRQLTDDFGYPRVLLAEKPDSFPADVPWATGPKVASNDLDGSTERSIWGGSLKVEANTGIGQLHSITAYRRTRNVMRDWDGDGVALRNPNPNYTGDGITKQDGRVKSFSQELRLDWKVGNVLDVVSGVYYLDQTYSRFEEFQLGGSAGTASVPADPDEAAEVAFEASGQSVTTKSIAVFTDMTLNLTDQFSVSGGIRYTRDKKTGYSYCADPGYICGAVFTPAEGSFSKTWSEPTWRLIATYKPTPDLMFYASQSRGFKSGGFSQADSPLAAKSFFNPEYVDSTEIGTKMELFDRRLTFNLTGFYAKTKDIQFLLYDGVARFFSGNLGGGRNTGIELEVKARPTRELSLWVNYVYQDSKYTDGAGNFGDDWTGNRLQLTPVHSLLAGFTYDKELANGGRIKLSSDFTYKSRSYEDGSNSREASTVYNSIVNARLAYSPPGDHFEIAGWVNNITNERNRLSTLNGFLSGYIANQAELDAGYNAVQVLLTKPRTYGVTLSFKY